MCCGADFDSFHAWRPSEIDLIGCSATVRGKVPPDMPARGLVSREPESGYQEDGAFAFCLQSPHA